MILINMSRSVAFITNIIKSYCGILKNIRIPYVPERNYVSSVVTVGILIIGDEILKGVTDTNTPFIIKQLNEINVKINRVSIVPDNVNSIAEEVSKLSSKSTFVLTSGGVGPTHDDVTYEAIAKAYNEELQLNQELFKFLVDYFGPESKDNPGIIKYSKIPESALVRYIDIHHNNKIIKYPIVSVRNVYIFPGVPTLLQKCFGMFKSRLIVKNKANFTKNIFIDLDEFSFISILNEAVNKFKNVKFGSYPTFTDNYYKVKLVLESPFYECIKEACNFFSECLPNNSVVNCKQNILSTAEKDVYSLCEMSSSTRLAMSVIEKTLAKYSAPELCLCLNGGKDCTVLLHLLYACIQHVRSEEWGNIHFLYVRNGETFSEVENFLQSTVKFYNIKLTILEGDLKQAISHYLETHKEVSAMFMGIRKCDPGASILQHFCMTDSNWPPVVRILPLLSWTYSDVWHFIRELQLPYCILYDQGYTSLGAKHDTIQNPSLLFMNHKGFLVYKPAYLLEEPENERNSRL